MSDVSEENVEHILNEYAPIVKRIAKTAYCSSSVVDITDLYQIGELAVLKAIKSYDPSSGSNIKAYVSRVVKNDIYTEAAKFFGIFTVDHRIPNLSVKISKLHEQGYTDVEIAKKLSTSERTFDPSYIRDVRIAHGRRHYYLVAENQSLIEDSYNDQDSIEQFLRTVASNDNEDFILKNRVLGDMSKQDVSIHLKISIEKVDHIENILKNRIKKSIEEMS